MPTRPLGLPDFKSPPVTEVVLGVQFNSIPGFLVPHMGLVWDAFRAEFPHIEERSPIAPAFETFGQGMQMQSLTLDLLGTPPMPRVFFVNEDRTQLLQLQRDRFIHNWRKIGAGDKYPRFERMIETFERGYERLAKVFESADLGTIVPNQCEVSYINQIEIPPDGNVFTLLEALFGNFSSRLTVDGLGAPADGSLSLRYVLSKDGVPRGRLSVQSAPGRRGDGKDILQLTLTARGAPVPETIRGVIDFLTVGRTSIVQAFAALTSPEMHKLWERTQ